MLDEGLALFKKADSGEATYYPNPRSSIQDAYVNLFTFVGKVVGKALWESQLLDCHFVKAFYKLILGIELQYTDMKDADEAMYKSLVWILEN